MKLGPHIIIPTSAALAWATQASIVKSIDLVSALQLGPPSAVKVFRHAVSNESDTSNPIGTVNAILGALGGYNDPNLYLQLWCGAHPTRTQLTQAVTLCHQRGYKTVGSSWFTGDYTQADWDDATTAGVDAYGPQCYWGNQGFTVDHALRYRQFWKPGQRPVAILECGRDAVEGGKAGWQASDVSGDQFTGELVGYTTEINKDSYVMGATVFQAGNTTDWKAFNTDPISTNVIQRLGGTVATNPVPVPTFSVGPGVAAKLAEHGDKAQSDEQYLGSNISFTAGQKGLYVYVKEANATYFLAAS